MEQISVSPLSQKAIRQIARKFCKMFDMENVLYFPIVQFIEWCLPELGMEYEIVEVGEMKNAYGVTHTGKGIMQIREDTYVGACEGKPRNRFTLSHELGHFLLHTPDRVSFARGKVPAYMNAEWQANTFAAELMAPYYLIYNMSVEEISRGCGMSYTASKIQYSKYHG